MRTRLVVTLAVLPMIAVACSSTPLRSAGTVCNSDSDCGAGLMCLGLGVFYDGGCTVGPKACSRGCMQDSDCTSLGSAFRCYEACDGSRLCDATE
jgi:hypothetical protein